MTEFHAATDADGVTTLTWDVPGKSLNVMSLQGLRELEAAVGAALADPAVKGIVITSGKADFGGGMDLAVLAGMREAAGADPAQGLFDGILGIHHLLRRIERAGMDPKTLTGGKPIAAALPGTAAGIALELPLACHRIFAADTPKARIGLPEIRVGLFPGAGGTTRLAWTLGAMAAAPYLLEGRMESPVKMNTAGIVHEVVPPEELLARAKAWVLSAPDIVKPWDRKGFRFPGGAPYSAQGFLTFVGASAMVAGKTMGVYPAARALLSAVYEGAQVPFDTALRIEARWFTQVLLDPSSAAMIRSLFLDKAALEKGANRPALPEAKVRRLGVIGAGMMGAGIAHVAAAAGINVVLIDATEEAAARGQAQIAAALEKAVERRKLTPEAKAGTLARLTVGADVAALQDCDLIVEAVFEDPGVKAEVIARAAAAAPGAVLATNTSTLPVTDLARATPEPERFLGLHFFSPVEKMQLVEVIRGRQTGDAAIAKALDFVRQIRKTPIVVNDARFFYANRCIIPYINEGLRMVGEGVAPALVENGARMAGMPVGPLQLVDETSLDLGARIARATRAALGADYPDDAVDAVLLPMVAAGRLGRKSGAGFYDYANGQRTGLAALHPVAEVQPGVGEVMQRLLMIQALEAVRALEAGVLTDIREGDVGAILGWGFAPWSGGPLSWLDRLGASHAVALAEALAAAHGPRFAPPPLLLAMAATGESFRHRFAPAA